MKINNNVLNKWFACLRLEILEPDKQRKKNKKSFFIITKNAGKKKSIFFENLKAYINILSKKNALKPPSFEVLGFSQGPRLKTAIVIVSIH